jgi:hypothetical protein
MGNAILLREKVSPGPEPEGDGAAMRSGRVEVIHGVYAHSLPLAGMTVLQARTELEDRMNIDPEALVVIDGVEADDDTVLCEGQVVNFVTPAGEKG